MSYTVLPAGASIPGLSDRISADCPEVHNALLRALPKRYTAITEMAKQLNSWRSIFPRESWMDGAASAEQIIWRSQFIDDDSANWETSLDEDCYRKCDYVSDEINIAQEVRNSVLHQRRLKTPTFCLEKLRDKDQRERVTSGYARALAENLVRTERDFVRNSFVQNSPYYYASGDQVHKHPAIGGHPRNGAPVPTHGLSYDLLVQMFMHLRVGRATHYAVATMGGARMLPVLMSHEAYFNLCHQDQNLKEVKLEVSPRMLYGAWAEGGDSLSPIHHFLPRITDEPRRFSYDPNTGTFTRVQDHIHFKDGRGGIGSNPNPKYHDWNCAPFEEVYFPSPKSGVIKVPTEIKNLGSGFDFDPQNYTGSIVPRNIISEKCNPDGNKMYLQGTLVQAFCPLETTAGGTLLIKRHNFSNGVAETWTPVCTNSDEQRFTVVACCAHGETSLFMSFGEPIPQGEASYTIQFGWGNAEFHAATILDHLPLANDPHRYVFEFNEPVDCGCDPTPKVLVISGACAIPSNSAGDDGCCPTPKEPLVCAPAAEVPEGYLSALDITLDPAPAVDPAVGATVFVNLGSQTVPGTVLAYADGVATIGFADCPVACDSGDGICGVTIGDVPPEATCYQFELECGQCVTGFADGNVELTAPVTIVHGYEMLAYHLNAVLGDDLFTFTACGLCYCGEGDPGPLTIGETAIEPSGAACPEKEGDGKAVEAKAVEAKK